MGKWLERPPPAEKANAAPVVTTLDSPFTKSGQGLCGGVCWAMTGSRQLAVTSRVAPCPHPLPCYSNVMHGYFTPVQSVEPLRRAGAGQLDSCTHCRLSQSDG